MIREEFGIPTVSPGHVLREEARAGTELGRKAVEYTSQGKLAPDAVVVGVVGHWLDQHDGSFVFDGFPRSSGQAEKLDTILEKRQTPLDVVLLLDVPPETIRERVLRRRVCEKCGAVASIGLHVPDEGVGCPRCGGKLIRREDDTVETLDARMKEYEAHTAPLIPFYEGAGLLKRVPSARRPGEVFEQIRHQIT